MASSSDILNWLSNLPDQPDDFQKDIISHVLAEIRANIFDFALLDWTKHFYALDPNFMKEDTSQSLELAVVFPGWRIGCPGSYSTKLGGIWYWGGNFVRFPSLFLVSSLFHRETAPMLYGHVQYSNWNQLIKPGEPPAMYGKAAVMVWFLAGIGRTNRRNIRSLQLCLDDNRPRNYPPQ